MRLPVMSALLLTLLSSTPALGIGQVRAVRWPRAARLAKEQGKIVFAMYEMVQSPGVEITDIGYRLRTDKARALLRKHVIVAELDGKHSDSMWSTFAPQAIRGTYHTCVFATPDGEFLGTVRDSCTVEEWIDAFQQAWDRYIEMLKSDPAYLAAMAARQELAEQRALCDEAEEALGDGRFADAMAAARQVLERAKELSPEYRRGMRVQRSVQGQARTRQKKIEGFLERDSLLEAFRELDELVHLFTGMAEAGEAAATLGQLLADPRHSEAAEQYRAEQQVYELYEKGLRLEESQDWKAAHEAFSRIVAEFKSSPVAERARRHARVCHTEALKMKRAADDACP